ncbi:hydroxymethylbilane synthase [Microbacterium sediminicola]|uniref:Hydroxymethylbilane synthase n=1 Tax=Microbacterium sediminicola TaxID=415210 RepID=A0ABP4U3B2_9MICO
MSLRLGTRASLLATTQSQLVADRLAENSGEDVELIRITTHGDVATGSLVSLGGTGVFATALREALLRGECDLIVHSLKDLPNAAFEGLTLICVPERVSARDVLCSRDGVGLDDLRAGAIVGTGSPRRAAQVLRRRPDVAVRDIRGNVDTRLRKVADGEFDAIVLAEAGLSRIGREDAITETFELDQWPTSAGQGALAVEIRTGDVGEPLGQALRALAVGEAEAAALTERAVLAELEAGCAAPIGVSAQIHGSQLEVTTEVYSRDGSRAVTVRDWVDLAVAAERAGRAGLAERIVTRLHADGIDGLESGPGQGIP